ncbi:carbohydrate ABC transporter permease [Ruegeria sp. EL01]|jgi:multiple sugar transport system permease protein|uniref:carbohydrate ABC transporter permease n=1 Tax=Ruegeria sp. EL01 TaxID=2107578 RepID=UPI000EA7F912|nr:sugar ABC transporter permease [Ruegeria sp. EL01]
MPDKAFFSFMAPSLLAMILFIALPIGSVFLQSLFVEHSQVMKTVETCSPFGGCTDETIVDAEATQALAQAQPLGRFNGLGTYTDRNHLAFDDLGRARREADTFGEFLSAIMNLRFYRALVFTIAFTAIVTPFVLALGLVIALAVNMLPRMTKGPAIFVSLLPMIVTPLVGSLILAWIVDAEGILGATLQTLFKDPDLSLKASPTLTWIMLFIYGIWHATPFSFIVFYAGLQTVPRDTLEAAMIDGASRAQRIRYVVVPHLMPLVTFVLLIQLMDNFRVFEPIVGFSADANATSLSWIIYNDLRGGETTLFGSAAATSFLTLVGVIILLIPVLIRTWRDHNSKPA